MDQQIIAAEFVRLPQIIGPAGFLPIGRTTFYRLVAEGALPAPIKIGRVSIWRRSELRKAVEALQR